MANEEAGQYRAHGLILPYPVTGHTNPMVQFSNRLQHKGMRITLALTRFMLKSLQEFSASFSVETISDGFDERGRAAAKTIEEYLTRFRESGTVTLKELVAKLENSGRPVDCIICDPFLPWGLDVAKELGLRGAFFFTQSCAVDNIYYQAFRGVLKLPVTEREIKFPGLPLLKPDDLPSFIYVHGSYPAAFEMILDQFANIEKADWVFVNTFYKLEAEVIDWLAKLWPVKAIGPTIPSMYLDKRLSDDKSYGLAVVKPIVDGCMKWLDQQTKRSVIYVSFGSLAQVRAEQMEELANCLESMKTPFLWIVREAETAKLPQDFSSEKGLIVPWCSQLDVLTHDSVGCFITHCGWNSTLEALSLGVPTVGIPQWTDQSTNAKFLMDVWNTGIRALPEENGVVRHEEIKRCVKHVMEGDTAEEIRKNTMKWKELAREAVDEGGSSDTAIEVFVSTLRGNFLK